MSEANEGSPQTTGSPILSVDEIIELYKQAGSRETNPKRRWQVEVAAEMIHAEMNRRLKANEKVEAPK